MTGEKDKGDVKPAEAFTTDANATGKIWGANGSFKGFAAVKPELYDPQLDRHANGANPDTPVFNIPEHKSSGFITLPNNGGFPTSSNAHDLSNNPAVAAASTGLTPPPGIDSPIGTTAFAQTLAHLESRDQPNDGYSVWVQDGKGIGAVGRYGFRAPSLQAIGWMDANGNWTAVAKAQGVDSVENFRDSPTAQETARVAYMQELKNELKANGAWSMVGETVEGHTITETGLIASARKEGAGAVLRVFNGNNTSDNVEKNVFFRLDEFSGTSLNSVSTSPNGSHPAGTPSTPSGHWEDTGVKLTDAEGNQTGVNVQKWVEDPSVSATGSTVGSTSTTTSPSSSATPATTPAHPTTPAAPPTTQISADGTTATLPSGGVIHAGTGASLSIDINGNLVVDRPAAGWTNADGSASDIRQITTYDPKGQQLGTVVAQNLPGQSALIENGEERSFTTTNADGTSHTVQAHFSAGTGWIDNQSGQTVQSIKDWQAQTDDHNAHLTPGPSADNDYQPQASNGEAEAKANAGTPQPSANSDLLTDAHSSPTAASLSETSNPLSDSVYLAQLENLKKLDAGLFKNLDTQTALADIDYDVINDQGRGYSIGSAPPAITDSTSHETASVRAAQSASEAATQAQSLAQANAALNLIQNLNALQQWGQTNDLAHLSVLMGLTNNINILSDGSITSMLGSGTLSLDNLNAVAGYINLAQSLESGNALGTLSAINSISGQAIDKAIGDAVGTTGVPYVGVVMALSSMEAHPGQAMGSLVGLAWGPLGSALGGTIGGLLESAGVFGDSRPPSPVGIVHFGWNADGSISTHTDQNISGGGQMAQQTAHGVQDLLNSIVQAINAKNPSTEDDVAINPYLLPKIGFSDKHAWIEITNPDGSTGQQSLQGINLAETLLKVLTDNGAIAPAWLVQTQLEHMHVLQAQGASESDIAAQLGAGKGGGASLGNEAYALQGNATESADYKTQSFGALVVHIHADPQVQGQSDKLQTTLVEVLRDADSDGYLERTQSVAARDAQGHAQASLVLDFNGNGLIETRDILNLGGNGSSEAGLQRNNVQWLDANGDGVLNARDPAFAAIRLWVDMNQDGQMQSAEGQSLQTLGIESINFKTGTVTYADGHSDVLTVEKLQGDTEGVRMTKIQQADANGVLHTLNAGVVLEHEGYLGQVQVTNQDGVTQWAQQRSATFEHQALRTGDWEGTAEQEAHRHGGGNVAGAVTETTATGATNWGDVKTSINVATQSTVQEGDARVVGDTPTQASPKANTQTAVAAGDSRIQSNAAATSSKPNPLSQPARPAENRIVFVPTAQSAASTEMLAVTDSMIESAQSALFGVGANAGLGVLTAIGLGAVQSALASDQHPPLVSNVPDPSPEATPIVVPSTIPFTSTPSPNAADSGKPTVTFRRVDLGSFPVLPLGHPVPYTATSADSPVTTQPLPEANVSGTPNIYASVVVSALQPYHPQFDAGQVASETRGASEAAAPGFVLGYPQVSGETLPGTEDTVLRLPSSVLLGNDHTPNASAKPAAPALTITAVSQPLHGQVSLVNGEVLFAPDLNFHGTAAFVYTVTDQYGLARTAIAQLQIAAVNDVPVTQGESVASEEDEGLIFTQAQLLANDSDVDAASDGQVLRISRVGQAQHGTVWLDTEGNLRFVPDANYHGSAQFTYWVSDGAAADGAGAEVPATVTLMVAAVNDIPKVQGETTYTTEDTALLIDAATLLANDSDVDVATDNQVLRIQSVTHATHCVVRLTTGPDGAQRIVFVPDANFHGTATFDYVVDDGNGGTAVATAVVNLRAVNDAPVANGETATGDEDNTLVFDSRDLLANDTDVDTATDGQVLHISRVGDAQHGVVLLDAQGQVRFVPDVNYHGPAQFTYWVSDGAAADGAGAEVPATVVLTILAVNDLPVVTDEVVHANEDTTLVFDPATLLANDTDADVATDGQVLHITAVAQATHGSVALQTQPDGSQRIVFTPEANYFGVASYQYTVSDGEGGNTVGTVVINLAQVNDIPVATDDTLTDTAEDTVLHIPLARLLGNDTDADSHNAQWGGTDDVLTISAVGNASHGTVALTNGEVVFTPDADYHGPASFAYQVRDSSGAVSQAIATLLVTAVNDVPIAVGETITSSEDTTLLISQAALLQNDSDADIATDGQVLRITSVFNAQHGSVSMAPDGTVSFVPDADFFGNARFDYTVDDGQGGVAAATAVLALASVDDAPVATGETISSKEDEVLTIRAAALLQNDTDVDNAHSELAISRVQSGAGGVASLDANGDVVFAPTANFNGTASFTYWVKDAEGVESNAVTTTLHIAAVNDAPAAQGEVLTGASEDAVFYINKASLLANDHDVDDPDSALSLSWVGNASGGTVSLDSSGNVVFVPNADFHGTASFAYKVRDAAGAESPLVQAMIPVAAVNDVPMAVDDQFSTYRNATMSIAFNQLTGNDTDADHDALTVSAVRDNANGHVAIVNGQVQFVANAGISGQAAFDYLADDGHGGQTWATAYVDVIRPPNAFPTMELRSTNFFGTGSIGIDIAYATFAPHDDDGDALVSVSLESISVYGTDYSQPVIVQVGSGKNNDFWWITYPYMAWQSLGGVNQFDWTNTSLHIDVRRGYAFTDFHSTWRLVDDQGLANIWHFNYSLSGGASSYMEHTGYASPIVLALGNDAPTYVSTYYSQVHYDMDGDGMGDKLAWAGAGSGVLGIDLNGDHRISDASEFAFRQYASGAETDMQGLAAFDTNHDGKLSASDAQWTQFGVWEDKNGDGKTQDGEFLSLDLRGIASINLQTNAQVHQAGPEGAKSDVVVMGEGAYTRTDGTTGVVADTMLAYQDGRSAELAQASDAHAAQMANIMRMALAFNQASNSAIDAQTPPLGFAPIQTEEQQLDHVLLAQVQAASATAHA